MNLSFTRKFFSDYPCRIDLNDWNAQAWGLLMSHPQNLGIKEDFDTRMFCNLTNWPDNKTITKYLIHQVLQQRISPNRPYNLYNSNTYLMFHDKIGSAFLKFSLDAKES